MAVNDDEKSSGITFWSKSLLLAHEIVRAGAFEWTNSARVAFSAGLIGPAKRAQCPSGVMAMKLIRCIGHDEEQKQEEVYSLDQEAQELLLWGQANLSKLLSLLSLLSAQRHHSFVLTPAEPEPRLDEALLLQALDSGERPFGVVFVSNVGAELASDDLAEAQRIDGPFNMMPKWFRGTACHSVCGWLLQCAPEALGSACALLGSDRLLLRTLQKSFALQRLAPFRSLDRFDAVVDAFDVVRVGVHFCSDHLGHGGMTCSHVHGDALDENLQEYRQILQSLHEAYPNLKFIHNSCNLQRWLPKRVHNCWPHLVSMGEDWQAFLELWNSCCAAAFGYGGNASCFRKQELQRLRIPQRLVIEDFAYPTCCEGLPFYQEPPMFEAWHGVHQLLPDVIAPNRLVNFHIVHDDPKTLSAAMGLQDHFKPWAWRQIHKSQRSASRARKSRDKTIAASWHAMAPKMSILEYRTAKIEAQMNTVGFESGGMPKRMQGTKPNNMDPWMALQRATTLWGGGGDSSFHLRKILLQNPPDEGLCRGSVIDSYKSRFETMGLAGGGSAAFAKSLQGNAEAVQQRAIALGEAMGAGGARVPVVADAGRTMEKMLEKFVNSRLDKYAVAAAERQNKEFKKEEKKKHKKKDKKKDETCFLWIMVLFYDWILTIIGDPWSLPKEGKEHALGGGGEVGWLRCSELRERLREEAEKAVLAEERHQAEREALETALRNTHAQGQKEQVQAVHALKTSGAEKESPGFALIAWAAEIQQMALDLQEALQEQLSGFRALTAAVRGLMKETGESIQGFPSVASRHWSPSRLTARTLIRSKYFEACSVLAILAGLVLLVFEVNADAKCFPEYLTRFQDCPVSSLHIRWLEECVARAYVDGSSFLCICWNLIDLATVAVGWAGKIWVSALKLNFLRAFRLLRICRGSRLALAIPELYFLVLALCACMKAFLFALALVGFVFFLWAIVTVQTLHPVLSRSPAFADVWSATVTLASPDYSSELRTSDFLRHLRRLQRRDPMQQARIEYSVLELRQLIKEELLGQLRTAASPLTSSHLEEREIREYSSKREFSRCAQPHGLAAGSALCHAGGLVPRELGAGGRVARPVGYSGATLEQASNGFEFTTPVAANRFGSLIWRAMALGLTCRTTRYWPKYRCDQHGNHCLIGESGGVGQECDQEGCAPPVDTKFEATFGDNAHLCDFATQKPGGAKAVRRRGERRCNTQEG
eukprot:g26966.t1